jgi:hypothetical protein
MAGVRRVVHGMCLCMGCGVGVGEGRGTSLYRNAEFSGYFAENRSARLGRSATRYCSTPAHANGCSKPSWFRF